MSLLLFTQTIYAKQNASLFGFYTFEELSTNVEDGHHSSALIKPTTARHWFLWETSIVAVVTSALPLGLFSSYYGFLVCLILPLVLETCNTSLDHVIFLQQISKPEKNHTGPFSTLKGYFLCIYSMFDCRVIKL